MSVDWSQLPPDLLYTIATKITIYMDYLRFRAVCVNWHSILASKPNHLPCQVPWLMIPPIPTKGNHRGFFSLTDNHLHFLQLPQARYKRCCGSSHGWLVLVENQSPDILLLNPLTKLQIQLPPITSFWNVLEFDIHKVGREYLLETTPDGPGGGGDRYTRSLKNMCDGFLKKVILSSPPGGEFIAIAILNETGELGFCKNGDSDWSIIPGAHAYCEDVVFHKGLLYAINKKKGAVAICDVRAPSPIVQVIEPRVSWLFPGDIFYLVVSFDELLLVVRHLEHLPDHEIGFGLLCETLRFEVFKLDLETRDWVEMESLGDCMLFVGRNCSVSLSTSDFRGCQGNHIYFTDEYTEPIEDGLRADHDVGVYDFGLHRVYQLPCYTGNQELFWPPHIWVTANPC